MFSEIQLSEATHPNNYSRLLSRSRRRLFFLLDCLCFLLTLNYSQGLHSACFLLYWRPNHASHLIVGFSEHFDVVALLVDVLLLQTAALVQNAILVPKDAVQVLENVVALLHARHHSLITLLDFIPEFKMVG